MGGSMLLGHTCIDPNTKSQMHTNMEELGALAMEEAKDVGPCMKDSVSPLSLAAPVVVPTANCSDEQVLTVDVHAAKDLIHSDHSYLDVRTVEEFNKGHVKDAVNIPYLFVTPEGRVKNPQFMEQVSAICRKDDFIVVGCASGARSLQASKELLSAGFKHVKNMGGGYTAWVEKGFVVNKPLIEIAVPSA